jgi:hypothetical protein
MGSLFRPHPGAARCHYLPQEKEARRAATGERRNWADFKFLTVRDLISAWTGGGYENAEGAARGHPGRFGTGQLEIADCRLQIGGKRGAATAGAARGYRGSGENDGAREDASTLSTLRRATEDGRSRATAEDGRPPGMGNAAAQTWRRTAESHDLGGGRWVRGGCHRMNGQAEGLSDCTTCFTYADRGLTENLRLSSLILAYSRLSSLNGKKCCGRRARLPGNVEAERLTAGYFARSRRMDCNSLRRPLSGSG